MQLVNLKSTDYLQYVLITIALKLLSNVCDCGHNTMHYPLQSHLPKSTCPCIVIVAEGIEYNDVPFNKDIISSLEVLLIRSCL